MRHVSRRECDNKTTECLAQSLQQVERTLQGHLRNKTNDIERLSASEIIIF